MDACTLILLAKASVLETALENYNIAVTKYVYDEVMEGKSKMFQDAFLVDKLQKENKLKQVDSDRKMVEKLVQDFNMGKGEASTIAVAIKEKSMVATDDKQGRKAAKINNLALLSSIQVTISLYKKKRISREKVIQAIKILEEKGRFEKNIIEKALEGIK